MVRFVYRFIYPSMSTAFKPRALSKNLVSLESVATSDCRQAFLLRLYALLEGNRLFYKQNTRWNLVYLDYESRIFW
jgi:hypothetical protein